MLLPDARRCIGFEEDPSYLNEAMLSRILLYARRISNEESYIDKEQEASISVELYRKTVEVIKV